LSHSAGAGTTTSHGVRQIGMSAPDIGNAEIDLALQVLRSGVLSIGPMVDRFEHLAAQCIGCQYGTAVSSGTAALHLCMIAAGIKDGDEVITTPFSFVASANAVVYERATPVFVDIDPRTYNLDVTALEERITSRTRAILPVHVFGQPVDLDPLLEISARHGLTIIEDACEAIGAEYKGRRVGSFGGAAAFAFYPNKQMTTGEGGMLVSNRSDWDRLFKSLRNQGRDDMDGWLNHSRLGYNYRMDELSAALGVVQLQRLEELLANRARVAAAYTERLAPHVPRIRTPFIAPTTTRMSWFVYVVELDSAVDRQRIIVQLAADGVPTRPYFPAIHLQPFYRERFGYAPGAFPVAEQASRHTLALPFHGRLTESDVDYVCERLLVAVKRS
jgi:perosamine synthetase